MTVVEAPDGALTLGHVLVAYGLDLSSVVALRHTYTPGGLETSADVTPATVIAWVGRQEAGNKLGSNPPRLWLNFMSDGGRRSRFLGAFENHGELVGQRVDTIRTFDLEPSAVMSSLRDRLVVEWGQDTINWAKSGGSASAFPVVEIADPVAVPFPGFDRLLITYDELKSVVGDRRYAQWRAALSVVQGIYLIADSSTGKLYVGKADGVERLLGRWSAYAHDGHGGNVGLKNLAGLDPTHSRHFRFSILQVFGPNVASREIDLAESHFKRALLSRDFGLNKN